MHRRYDAFWIVLYALCFTAIVVLSLDSHPPQVDLGVLNWDKLQHAAAYAVLTFLGVMAFRPLRLPPRLSALAVFALSVLLGGALEIGQGALTETRFADMNDLLANTLGAAVGMMIPYAPFPGRTSHR